MLVTLALGVLLMLNSCFKGFKMKVPFLTNAGDYKDPYSTLFLKCSLLNGDYMVKSGGFVRLIFI